MALLTRLGLPGDEQAWAALGFTVRDGAMRVGQLTCTFGEASWGFDETHAEMKLLGVPESPVEGSPPDGAATHPNAVTKVDHVVYWVPDLDTAITNLTAVLGDPPRRRFHPRGPDGPEMAFYRVGEAFVEVVTSGQPEALVGVAFRSSDLDATVAAVRAAGGPIGDPKPAVQGGRIASVWHGHTDWGIAFMEAPAR
ncbi:VOC family protein [Nocardia sp. NPDC050406]|uniref:VOC family protein n=1 Tax=Nocardia sp. NPDC050406 TaxID=3364318 RepID=UPI00378F879F